MLTVVSSFSSDLDRMGNYAKSPALKKPLALLVVLENVGHLAGFHLPDWAKNTIDFVTEEYAKMRLWQLGAYARYDRVEILEDEQVTGAEVVNTLLRLSLTHCVDQLLLVHGQDHSLVGYRAQYHVDHTFFDPLLDAYASNPQLLDLRMIYGLNCFGASLAPTWIQLGACAVNGSIGVNWLPETSLSVFLKHWLGGSTFSRAVAESNRRAIAVGKRVWPNDHDGHENVHIAGSRQIVFGRHDLTLHTPPQRSRLKPNC